MPKNEVIQPDREERDDPFFEVLAKEKKLHAKMKTIETKLKFELEQHPPEDTEKEEQLVSYWEQNMESSLAVLRGKIQYQEGIILEAKQSYEKRLHVMEERLSQTKANLIEKERFYASRVSAAQAQVEYSKRKLDPKARKHVIYKETKIK